MNPSLRSTGFFRARRRLYFVGIALIAITVAAAAITIRDLREQAIEGYQRDITNIGVLLVEQMSRSLQVVDLVIRETRERALGTGADTHGGRLEIDSEPGVGTTVRIRLARERVVAAEVRAAKAIAS
jgi:hypothetical protein